MNIVISLLVLILIGAVIFLPRFSKKEFYLVCVLLASILVVVTFEVGLIYLAYLSSLIFIFWGFMFGFTSNRKYPYVLALIFLVGVPVFLSLGFDTLAEFLAILVYFLLVLGVIKDIFYEKVFKN